jgi:hypothetical protein
MKRVLVVLLGVAVLGVGLCGAQDADSSGTKVWVMVPGSSDGGGVTIRPPGEMPTTVTPGWGGGYTIRTPGELPTHVRPQWGGGYTVQKWGELPTRVTPDWGGGYTIRPPGELKKIIAVVGATGAQGGGLVRAILS